MSVKTVSIVLGALVSALALGLFVSRSAAAEKVDERMSPLAARVSEAENRLTRLETQRVEDVKKIDEIRSDVKVLLERVPPRR